MDRLLGGEVALKPMPVLMRDGGDLVPLAIRGDFQEGPSPRWWSDLTQLLAPQAGKWWGGPRRPIYFASSNYGIDGLYSLGKSRLFEDAHLATPHGCVAELCAAMGWGGNHYILSHACVSGQLAIERASQAIRSGAVDESLVVTFDFVGPFVSGGFHALKILNDQFPSPYADREIGSIGLGDGAAYMILSPRKSSFRVGLQNTYNEMFHFTANEPTGSGFKAILAPYREITSKARFWVKGHGTGTLEAGRLEASVIKEFFPESPLVSWKGALGHTLGSCAAVELVLAMKAFEQGRSPGTIGSSAPFFSDRVQAEPFSMGVFDSVLLLSNAFGGAHASLLLHYE